MKALSGCVCAGEDPPGPYSTSTALMLLPGTFGRTWSKTIPTLASPPSRDLPTGSCASAAVESRSASAPTADAGLIMASSLKGHVPRIRGGTRRGRATLRNGSAQAVAGPPAGGRAPPSKGGRGKPRPAPRQQGPPRQDDAEVRGRGVGHDITVITGRLKVAA